MLEQENETCIPWFFPSIDPEITIRDPWQTNKFIGYMNNDTISNDSCAVCLPGFDFYIIVRAAFLRKSYVIDPYNTQWKIFTGSSPN